MVAHHGLCVVQARRCHIDESQLPEVVRFLHNVGVLIHFDDPFGDLSDLVIINPQWLASVMKTVVSFSNTWCKNGVISEGDLHTWVWRDYPAHLHRNMQRIFEKFQVYANSSTPSPITKTSSLGDVPASRRWQ